MSNIPTSWFMKTETNHAAQSTLLSNLAWFLQDNHEQISSHILEEIVHYVEELNKLIEDDTVKEMKRSIEIQLDRLNNASYELEDSISKIDDLINE